MTDSEAAYTAPPGSLIERMGMHISSVAADRCVASMPVEGNRQTHGVLHGGASAALAETVGSLAAAAHAAPDRIAVGVDLSITHHRAVTAGSVHATAEALHRGRSTASYAISIRDDEGRLAASARITCALITRP